MRRVLARLEELERIETCGQMLPLSEINKLRNKPALQEELEELMRVCRGWWEADEEFEARLDPWRPKAPAKRGPKGDGAASGARAQAQPTGKRAPPTFTKRRTGGGGGGGIRAAQAAAKTKVSGGGFAALADDSDSD